MPLFRTPNAKLIYFAHVPKCAGTAVERYLSKRFGTVAMRDSKFGGIDPDDRWSATSPQHMPEWVRERYLPDGLLDGSFAIVRHPATRLRSVFLFQREIEGKVPLNQPFEAWIEKVGNLLLDAPNAFDGHIRSMVGFVPKTAEVFRIEDGLDSVVTWLDGQTDSTAPKIEMASANVLESRLRFEKRPIPKVWLTDAALERIAQLYSADYERFGYDLTPPEQESAA